MPAEVVSAATLFIFVVACMAVLARRYTASGRAGAARGLSTALCGTSTGTAGHWRVRVWFGVCVLCGSVGFAKTRRERFPNAGNSRRGGQAIGGETD